MMIKVNTLPGYENLMDIYYLNEGLRIVSAKKNWAVLKPRLNSSGYLGYNLSTNDGGQKTILLHRVIALACISNPKDYPEINHIDENKLNNNPSNLMWCDHKYNCNYGTRIQRYSEKALKKVRQIDKDGNVVAVYPGVIKATKALGLKSKSAITNCIAGISKTCCGYRWEYV